MRGGEHDGAGEGEAGDGPRGPNNAPAPRIGRRRRLADPPCARGSDGGGGGLCASFCLNCNYLIIDYHPAVNITQVLSEN